MTLDPRNRHLLVKPIEEEEEKEEKPVSGVLLPDSYKPQQSPYVAAKVIELAPDCSINCEPDNIIIIERSMLNEVNFGEEVFYLVLENYVLGVLEGHRKQEADGLCGIDTEKYTQ